MQPLVVVNTVGLTGRHVALAPRLSALARAGWQRPLREVLPAVTCTAQAALLTGRTASAHGIVGNGWLFRDTGEVRFWQQSNRLLQAEPLYVTARQRAAARGQSFRCAKLFWWFNQGAAVDVYVTPKPHYGADGNKAFDILGAPTGLTDQLKKKLGDFPFRTFWGPTAGLPCTQWIARCAAEVIRGQGVPGRDTAQQGDADEVELPLALGVTLRVRDIVTRLRDPAGQCTFASHKPFLDHAARVSAGLRAAELRRQRGLEPRSARLRVPGLLARVLRARRRAELTLLPRQEP